MQTPESMIHSPKFQNIPVNRDAANRRKAMKFFDSADWAMGKPNLQRDTRVLFIDHAYTVDNASHAPYPLPSGKSPLLV